MSSAIFNLAATGLAVGTMYGAAIAGVELWIQHEKRVEHREYLKLPLQIESESRSGEWRFSRSDPENLRCVIDCRMFPKPPGGQDWVQNQRTFCYSCAKNRKDL